MRKLLIFLICSSFIFGCNPSKQLAYHMNKADKILKEYPELKKNIKLDSLIKQDTITTNVELNDTLDLVGNIETVDSLVNLLFLYKQIEDSLRNTSSKDTLIIKEIQKINYASDKLKNEIIKSAYKNDTFNVEIKVIYQYEDSIVIDDINVKLRFSEGKIYLESKDTLNFLFEKTDYVINVENEDRIRLFAWLKDEKTQILIGMLIVLFLIAIIKLIK